ncbi:MAG: 2-phospho-L-lactate guanylyltransferase, partial [Methanotrichaceae archaeon]|nr:2-phospho-L-lactate guanylyltransferase [Methanotrichaceae archaeon]
MHRPVRFIVPFKHNGAKSRLSSVLTQEERRRLAFAMLSDVLDVVTGFSCATVLSRPGLDIVEVGRDVDVLESELDLNDALNSLIAEEVRRCWPSDILIVMADLALLTGKDVAGILNCDGDVVLCPGRGGGTNMILIRSPKFRTCYQGLSFQKHLEFAKKAGLKATVFESFRASCDIDEPDDLSEVLIHGCGRTRNVLESMGFSLYEKGRAKLAKT